MSENFLGKEPHYRGSFIIKTKQDMATMFHHLSPRYDFLNHFLSLGNDLRWRRKSAGLLRFSAGARILDFGAGTGDFALALRRVSDVTVTAVDLVPEMLKRFLLKLNGHHSHWLLPVTGDGEMLPFKDNHFDGVVSGFVGRNLLDMERGISEIYRVLKKGGKVGFLEFCKAGNPVINMFSKVYFRHFVPWIGNLFVPKHLPAYTYLVDSIESFYTADELSHIFTRMGFRDVEYRLFNMGMVVLVVGVKS